METLLKDSAVVLGATLILSLSVGIYIFNSAANSIGTALDDVNNADTTNEVEVVNIEDEEDDYITSVKKDVDTFNEQWTEYQGELSGSEVRELITKVRDNTTTYSDDENKLLDLEYEATRGNKITITTSNKKINLAQFDTAKESIEIGNTYFVSVHYSDVTNYIDKITISYDRPIYGE